MVDNNTNTPVPTFLDLLIRTRIDALPLDLKQVIQVAAVLGAPIDVDALSSVCETPDIEATLDILTSRQLVRKASENQHWTFYHPLIEGVVYESIHDSQRIILHQKIADFFDKNGKSAESNHTEELAYHLTRANQNVKAINTLVTAGEKGAAKSDNEQAAKFFKQALEILSMVPKTPEQLRWRLAVGLGDAYRAMGQYNDSMAALRTCIGLMETGRLDALQRAGLYRRMGNTARKLGDYQTANSYFRAATLILGEPRTTCLKIELARVLTGLAWSQFHQGLFDTARETAERGLKYAETEKSLVDLAALENLLGGIYYSQSDWAAASQHTKRAMELRQQMGQTWGLASTLGNLGVLAILEGDWEKARSFFEQSLSMREEMDAEGLALVHNNLGNLFRDQGNLSKAEIHYRESLNASQTFDHSYHSANATLGLASVLFLKEDQNNAHMALTQALQIAEEIGANDVITEARRVEVEMLIAEGKLKPAFKTAQTSLQHAKETGNRNHQVSLWRLISTIELAQGHIEVAKNALEQSQELLSDVTDMLELGRTHTQAARIAMTLGDTASLNLHLQEAQETFMKLGAEMDLMLIRQLSDIGEHIKS